MTLGTDETDEVGEAPRVLSIEVAMDMVPLLPSEVSTASKKPSSFSTRVKFKLYYFGNIFAASCTLTLRVHTVIQCVILEFFRGVALNWLSLI